MNKVTKVTKNIGASVRTRLLTVAKAQGVDFNQVLVRFALERVLYRLSVSEHADKFLLKGALLFSLWYDLPHRPTRDADLLGFGPDDIDSAVATFREICKITVEDALQKLKDADKEKRSNVRKDSRVRAELTAIIAERAKAKAAETEGELIEL